MARRAGQGSEGYGGHWVTELAHHVTGASDIELGIATAYPGLNEARFQEGRVRYFVIPQPRRLSAFVMRKTDLRKCVAVIEEFKPDLIHVHGSERLYGLVKMSARTPVPMLVSLQGLLGSFSLARHFFGTLSLREILQSNRLLELPARLGLAWQYLDAKRGARREATILAAADGFLGRTEWDRAHSQAFNPTAPYFHVGEILRPAFYKNQWSLQNCERFSLIYTNAGHPSRGTENLLAAVAFLSREFPKIKLRLAGRVSTRSGYGRFIRDRIRRLGLSNHVELLGYIDDAAMAAELLRAQIFAITSYIENSPNSLAEAMLAGLPCVASFVGGIPSMVQDGDTGLLYPVDDVPLLAEKIRRIFTDDALASGLGANACNVARKRHDPKTVLSELTSAYRTVLASQRER